VGTSGYHYDDWIGVFNPPKGTRRQLETMTEDQDPLTFYQTYFSFVEINDTFYTEPTLPHFLDIQSRSKESMVYSVKVHKNISETKECETGLAQDMMRRHITAVSPLIESGRFFSFLIQLDDQEYRTQKKLDFLLRVAAVAVSERIDVHIEFRHISWHAEPVLTALKNAGVGICNTEIPCPEHRFPLKAYATTDKGYIRYSGLNTEAWYPKEKPASPKERVAQRNARYDYEYSDEELLQRVKGQLVLRSKTSLLAVAFNNHFQAKAVRNAIKSMSILDEMLHS
jgi:uncharacterized protein YecE (DUF72 family)